MKIQRKAGARGKGAPQQVLRVAAVQFRSGANISNNVGRMREVIATCAQKGVQVVAFPECALTSYAPAAIRAVNAAALAAAEVELAQACGQFEIAALVGSPQPVRRKWRNAAVFFDNTGLLKARYTKQYLVGGDLAWSCVAGEDAPPVFPLACAKASVIICHDNRYPELCRLPVLAGAQVMFYLSHECSLAKSWKLGPCRAQVQARAVENGIFLVHANAPSDGGDRGSHGESRIVDPNGNLILEAGQKEEEILIADLDLSLATRSFALKSLRGPYRDWWREGVRRVRLVN